MDIYLNDVIKRQKKIKKAPDVPKPMSIWKHYKGETYVVEGIGMHESNQEIMVIYNKADDSMPMPWVRPLSEWNEELEYHGRIVDRFTLEGETESLFMKTIFTIFLLVIAILISGLFYFSGSILKIVGEYVYNYCIDELKFGMGIAWIMVLFSMMPIVCCVILCIKMI